MKIGDRVKYIGVDLENLKIAGNDIKTIFNAIKPKIKKKVKKEKIKKNIQTVTNDLTLDHIRNNKFPIYPPSGPTKLCGSISPSSSISSLNDTTSNTICSANGYSSFLTNLYVELLNEKYNNPIYEGEFCTPRIEDIPKIRSTIRNLHKECDDCVKSCLSCNYYNSLV